MHALGVLAADAPRHCVPKWLRFTGKPASATLKALAAETEPPQVSSLVVAQIQWQRTLARGKMPRVGKVA